MIATLSLFAAFVMSPPAMPAHRAMTLDINTKDGAVLAGEYVFRVTVQSEKPVSQVEMYVGEDLRGTDTSTPYEFKVDTLAESEGDLKVTFAAYSTDNESVKKSVTVRIDNGLSKGADFHVQRAREFIVVSKWDEAIEAGRVALKAKAGYNPARLTMARAYLGKGILDSAQRYAEDALASDPKFTDASELLTVINLQRAFNTFHRGTTDPSETLQTIAGALKSAVEIRRKGLDAAVDGMTPTRENAIAYADAAIRAMRYSAAIGALMPLWRNDSTNPALVDRIAFCLIRMARFADADQIFFDSVRQQKIDAYGYALKAVIQYHLGDTVACDDAMREAILSDNEDQGVRSAQVYLAVARGKRDVVAKLVKDWALDQSMRTEVQYYLTQAYTSSKDYTAAQRTFESAVMTEPANYDAYVQRANESLAIAGARSKEPASKERDDQIAYNYRVAKVFFETALTAKPDSAEALTGLAIIAILQKDNAAAFRLSAAAASALPSYAPGRYLYSSMSNQRQSDLRAAIEVIRKANKDGTLDDSQRAQIAKLSDEVNRIGVVATQEMDAAAKLDKMHLEGRGIPNFAEVQKYFLQYWRLPLVTAPK